MKAERGILDSGKGHFAGSSQNENINVLVTTIFCCCCIFVCFVLSDFLRVKYSGIVIQFFELI